MARGTRAVLWASLGASLLGHVRAARTFRDEMIGALEKAEEGMEEDLACLKPWEAVERDSGTACVEGILTAILPALGSGHLLLQAPDAEAPAGKPNRGLLVDMHLPSNEYAGKAATWYSLLRVGQLVRVGGKLHIGHGTVGCQNVLKASASSKSCFGIGENTTHGCLEVVSAEKHLAEIKRVKIGGPDADVPYPLSLEDGQSCHYEFSDYIRIAQGAPPKREKCQLGCPLSRYAGMLADFTGGDFVVTGLGKLGRFGVVGLSSGGSVLQQPTQVVAPGEEAAALTRQNLARMLHLDDGSTVQNPTPLLLPDGRQLTGAGGELRGGDHVAGEGVIVHMFDVATATALISPAWRVLTGGTQGADAEGRPVPGTATVKTGIPRTARPPLECGGTDVAIASVNVLNFFLTPQPASGAKNVCGPACAPDACPAADKGIACRGWEGKYVPDQYTAEGVCKCSYNCTDLCTTYKLSELDRQKLKLGAELKGLAADVYVLQEVQNDPDNAAQEAIVAMLGPRFKPALTRPVGGDAIKSGIVYDETKLELVGQVAELNDRWVVDNIGKEADVLECAGETLFNAQRPILAATFRVRATGGLFTTVGVHLKSKNAGTSLNKCKCASGRCTYLGAVCPNCDRRDGQAAWVGARLQAVEALVKFIASNPTGVEGASERVVVLGDFNSYAKEEPMVRAEQLGLLSFFSDPETFSFAFDGQWGSLDHALGTAKMRDALRSRATKWHINSLEPAILRYGMAFKDSGAFVDSRIQFWAAPYSNFLYNSGAAFPQWRTLFNEGPEGASDHDPILLCATL